MTGQCSRPFYKAYAASATIPAIANYLLLQPCKRHQIMSTLSETKKMKVTKQTKQTVTVDWDGADDATNPRNWGSSRKLITIVLLSAVTFNM